MWPPCDRAFSAGRLQCGGRIQSAQASTRWRRLRSVHRYRRRERTTILVARQVAQRSAPSSQNLVQPDSLRSADLLWHCTSRSRRCGHHDLLVSKSLARRHGYSVGVVGDELFGGTRLPREHTGASTPRTGDRRLNLIERFRVPCGDLHSACSTSCVSRKRSRSRTRSASMIATFIHVRFTARKAFAAEGQRDFSMTSSRPTCRTRGSFAATVDSISRPIPRPSDAHGQY